MNMIPENMLYHVEHLNPTYCISFPSNCDVLDILIKIL